MNNRVNKVNFETVATYRGFSLLVDYFTNRLLIAFIIGVIITVIFG